MYDMRVKIDDAWTTTPDVQTPVIDGARQSAVAVRKKIDGAWVDVWTLGVTASLSENLLTMETASDYSYSFEDTEEYGVRTKLVYSISNNKGGRNHMPFVISKREGFGKTIKIEYYFYQTLGTNTNAELSFLDKNYVNFTGSKQGTPTYQTSSTSAVMHLTGTYEMDEEQDHIFLLIGSNRTNIDGYIYGIKINDELVKFR